MNPVEQLKEQLDSVSLHSVSLHLVSLPSLKCGQTSTESSDSSISTAQPSLRDIVVDEAETDGDIASPSHAPPMDGGVGAWSFCAAAFIIEMIIYGFCFSYGLLQDYYVSHPPFDQQSLVSLAAVGPIAIGLQYLPAFLITSILERYPDYIRVSMWTGLFLSFFSLFCSSWATKVWQLILLQGVVYGMSGGLTYLPILKMISDWFDKKRGLATGLIFAGAGVGGFVFPYILKGLLNAVGLPWTLRIWAIGTNVLCGIALMGIRPRVPFKKYKTSAERPKWFPPQLVWVKTPLYWSSSITIFFVGIAYFPVSLYIATYTRELINPTTATIVLSIFNSAAVGGQVLLGHLTDSIPFGKIMFWSTFLSGVCVFCLWGFAQSAAQLYVFVIVFGVLSGGFSSTWASLAYELAGHKAELVGWGIASGAAFRGIAAVIGPVVSGVLLEAGKGTSMGRVFGREGYGTVEIFVGTCCLAAAASSLVVSYYTPPHDPIKSEASSEISAEKPDETVDDENKVSTELTEPGMLEKV